MYIIICLQYNNATATTSQSSACNAQFETISFIIMLGLHFLITDPPRESL